MQSANTQAYRQLPSTPSQNSGSGSPSRRRISDCVTSGFASGVVPSYYDAQSYTTPDIYRDQTTVPTGPTYNNDAYGGGTISGYDFNLAMAGSLRTPAFRPQHNGDYSMPSTSYSNVGQREDNGAGYHFGTDQFPGPATNFPSHVSEANASPNQGTSPIWRLHNCWISHAEQDGLHLTIALKKT